MQKIILTSLVALATAFAPLPFNWTQVQAAPTEKVQAPVEQSRPNVLMWMMDDVGFAQIAGFGGLIATPNIDRVANMGLRYTNYHTAPICSASRAAMLAGRNPHSVNMGGHALAARPMPGYSGVIDPEDGSIAANMKQAGYLTLALGKWDHLPSNQMSHAGPFTQWPVGQGFDRFYGFLAADTNNFDPVLIQDTASVKSPGGADYHLDKDLANQAISMIHSRAGAPTRAPFFMYYATGTAHAPHHAPKEWLDRYKGKFDMGWDRYREETIARQKQLGVVPQAAKLTQRSEGLPAWDSLNADQKKIYARMMEVFAAYGAHVDHHMGRIVDAVKQLPDADNTLFVYIAGDNGASAEGGIEGSINENLFFNGFPEKWQDNLKAIDDLGGPKYFNHFPSAWAHAMNTPFQWTKQVASHFGGTRNPMIVSWPARIADKGGLRSQFLHVIDVTPTIYELAGITAPTMLNGVPQKPIEGTSFVDTFADAKARDRHTTQYFELGVNRGIYHRGWMASAISLPPWQSVRTAFDPDKQKWELYNVDEDFSQATDLAAANPQKLRELQDMWWAEAGKYNVLPLDWRASERLNAEAMGRPSLTGDRKVFTYYPGQVALPNEAAPRTLNKSWTMTATVETGGGLSGGQSGSKSEGMIVTQGGIVGGFGLYLRDGKPTFVYNYLALERTTVAAEQPLPPGKAEIKVEFAYEGKPGEFGKPATVTLSVDGRKVGEARLARTVPVQYALAEGLDIGEESSSPIDFTYKPPFKFTGKIDKVVVELK